MIALPAHNMRTVKGRCGHDGDIERYPNIYAGLTQQVGWVECNETHRVGPPVFDGFRFAQPILRALLAGASAPIVTGTTYIFARDPC